LPEVDKPRTAKRKSIKPKQPSSTQEPT